MEFDGDVVNIKMNDDDTTDNISFNFLGTSNTLSEGCCKFSDVYVQDVFLDRNLSDYTSKDLK